MVAVQFKRFENEAPKEKLFSKQTCPIQLPVLVACIGLRFMQRPFWKIYIPKCTRNVALALLQLPDRFILFVYLLTRICMSRRSLRIVVSPGVNDLTKDWPLFYSAIVFNIKIFWHYPSAGSGTWKIIISISRAAILHNQQTAAGSVGTLGVSGRA